MAKKRRTGIPKPSTTLQTDAVARLQQNQAGADPRQFRDALTKVTGGIRGIPTETTQWNRWSP